jgi:mannose-6-phosphate isomerase-like protein (cupin superfamily)
MDQFAILPRAKGVLLDADPISVRVFDGGIQYLETEGTLFFAVAAGYPTIRGVALSPGMYGSIPHGAAIKGMGDCRVLLVDHRHYTGIFALGGPIETQGRLRYINGCTDTGLVQPLKLGDPCLNALFFPARTLQSAHRHPSHRIGVIYDGEGVCHTDPEQPPTPMRKGDLFFIPANALHWFETAGSDMRIMIFHPDSEFGPTDEKHQMREATIIA